MKTTTTTAKRYCGLYDGHDGEHGDWVYWYSEAEDRELCLTANDGQPLDGLTEAQIERGTRGIGVARYRDRFDAGARSHVAFPDLDLDKRLDRYRFRSPGEEGAFLDGNTYSDEDADTVLARRITEAEG